MITLILIVLVAALVGIVLWRVNTPEEVWPFRWRIWFGWSPVQFCVICGKMYFGGWPVPTKVGDGLYWVMSWMTEYCSKQCAKSEFEGGFRDKV